MAKTRGAHGVICSIDRFFRPGTHVTCPETDLMASNFADDPAKPEENTQTDHEREFDRWRTAVELIQRMREAGIGCDLFDGCQNRH